MEKPFYRSWHFISCSRYSLHFMQTEGSLPSSGHNSPPLYYIYSDPDTSHQNPFSYTYLSQMARGYTS